MLTLGVARRFYVFSFVCLRIVFSFVGGDYCTNTVPCFYHTINSVYGALHCALLLMITTPAQKDFFLSFCISSLLSSSWIASMLTWWRSLSSCFLVNFPISIVNISIWRSLWSSALLIYQGAQRCSQVPCFEIVQWCQCCSVSCIPTAGCRRSTKASIFVCTASAYCVSTGPISFPWANTFSCILVLAFHIFSWHLW